MIFKFVQPFQLGRICIQHRDIVTQLLQKHDKVCARTAAAYDQNIQRIQHLSKQKSAVLKKRRYNHIHYSVFRMQKKGRHIKRQKIEKT
ncbi:hypothetical protein EVA_11192 [gut metagenome]|uniref:Uncharacterized protein n=1 Tax=gut metagenome TaxID=749906 RepID=J9GFY3_9ZZZZ